MQRIVFWCKRGVFCFLLSIISSVHIIPTLAREKATRRTSRDQNTFSNTALMDKLLEDYDMSIRPHYYERGYRVMKPTQVSCEIMIDSIDSVDALEMEYTINIRLRQWWIDQRLRYDDQLPHNRTHLTVHPTYLKKIWRPSVFFANENDGHFHNLTTTNFVLNVFPNGTVWYSARLTLVLGCQMWLVKYPLDNQTCPLELQSYGLTVEEQVLSWADEPFAIEEKVNLPQFNFEGIAVSTSFVTHLTGNFSNLVLMLSFRREIGYHLIQSYIPMMILVMTSWVSFWLDADAVVGRVSLGITTLLTVNTLSSTVGKDLPIVSYAKAIDVWTGTCATFVFAAFIEYACVCYYQGAPSSEAKLKTDDQGTPSSEAKLKTEDQDNMLVETKILGDEPLPAKRKWVENGVGVITQRRQATSQRSIRSSLKKTKKAPSISRAKRIDVVARFAFPSLFLFFNLTYWTFYVLII